MQLQSFLLHLLLHFWPWEFIIYALIPHSCLLGLLPLCLEGQFAYKYSSGAGVVGPWV